MNYEVVDGNLQMAFFGKSVIDKWPSVQMAFFGKSLIDKGKEGACLHLPLDDRSLDEDTQSADPLKSNDPFAFPDSPVKTTLPPQPAEKELLASANSGVHNAAVQLADPVHQMAPQSDDDSDKIQALGWCYFLCVSLCCNCIHIRMQHISCL